MEVQILEVGKSYATEEVHFSGGLRGLPTNRGWALFPVSEDAGSDALVFRTPRSHFKFATEECGLLLVGTCIHYRMGGNSPPMDVWEPGQRDPSNGLHAADSWSAIAHQAELNGDSEYANSASYVSVCLKVAGLRLRDLSNKYNAQLKWALGSRKALGTWFSNAALLDLYADCHSLVSELSSARDHLARIAAIHVGAPDRIDSLARLEEWTNKLSNHSHATSPLVHGLLSASGTKENPNWLRRLGEIRNEMLHQLPMAANQRVSALTLQESLTTQGPIRTIRLGDPSSNTPLVNQAPDPLVELSQLSTNLEHVCRASWKAAKYPALLPVCEDDSDM